MKCEECGEETKRTYRGWVRGMNTKPDRVCKKCHDKIDKEAAAGLEALLG